MRNSSRTWLLRENERFASTISSSSTVLDAGAGSQPYRRCFEHCRYEAADFEKVDKEYRESTYVCDLAAIPVESGRFDAVVFNQVIEHLPDPSAVLVEFHRVLKPGGRMICTGPLFYDEHEEPYDYYRYTQFGLRYLMNKAGFEIVRMDWLEGYFGTVAYQLETAQRYLPTRPSKIAPGLFGWLSLPFVAAAKIIFFILAHLFYRIDEVNKYTEQGFPKNYVVIVRKPALP